ncbi:MAG: hypothetical protein KF903_10915 [Dokdonella sp.]|uniref:hypothetical protein n=1 Tax=Dokdonella sp. TaxID=2291710 RepID=UPI0025B9BBCF|nr:hypothetical protein [Dokdonella sp.]MBX3701493.1 hypothetical protein [Dokdonella sp.]MCW5579227.1 hypothetical protein [Dokdonella sp.]
MIRTSVLSLALLALAGCGGGKPPAQADQPAAAPAPEQRQKTVFDDQLKAIDKAKGVEQQLMQEKERHDKQIEAQEKGDAGS